MAQIYLIHVKAWNGSAEVTLNFSDRAYITGSSNLPPSGSADTYYDPRIIQPAIIQQECWSNGQIGGASRVSFGTIELANTDGGLDYLTGYALDGRTITVIIGEVMQGGTPTWTTVMSGKMAPPIIGVKSVILYLRDRMIDLEKPVCTSVYAGTGGLEGDADGLGGSRKPRLFGACANISPPCPDTIKLIYQVNDGAIYDVCNVYDQGAALTKGADYADISDMNTNAPTAGTYRALPDYGYFRIGATPVGSLTCDAIEGAAAADRTAAQLTYDIGIIAGLSSGDMSSSDITALDTANSSEIGVYYRDETTCLQAIDQIQNSVGAWWGFDSLGFLRMKQWTAPSGTPVMTLTVSEIEEIERITDENSIPMWRLNFNYLKNYTVQNQDIAGSVTADRRAIISAEWAVNQRNDSSVKTANLSAVEAVKNSHITAVVYNGVVGRDIIGRSQARTSAGAEGLRWFNLFKVQRQRYEVTVLADPTTISGVSIGDVVTIQINRFAMSSGVDFRVLGVKKDMNARKLFLSLWG